LQLQRIARLLPVSGRFAVHEVDGVNPLVSGRSDAASEQVQEYIAMASEDRTELLGIPLARQLTRV
jgi:hypothetical protein